MRDDDKLGPDEFRLFGGVYTTSIHDERAPVNGYITNRLDERYGLSREEIAKSHEGRRAMAGAGVAILALFGIGIIVVVAMAN